MPRMVHAGLAASIARGSSADDPTIPHLAQAWTALSTGDGLPGETGEESYIFADDSSYKQGGVRGHWWKYGEDCQKLTLNTWKPHVVEKSFYLKCDSVNCCYKDDQLLKQWDIDQGILSTVSFRGIENTTELDENPVLNVEHWMEKDTIPMAKTQYDFFVTRDGDDVITHRIEFGATKIEPGVILYGNFTVQHDASEFAKIFQAPERCDLRCPDAFVAKWDSQRFRSSALRVMTRAVAI